jgi:hypothetical protein
MLGWRHIVVMGTNAVTDARPCTVWTRDVAGSNDRWGPVALTARCKAALCFEHAECESHVGSAGTASPFLGSLRPLRVFKLRGHCFWSRASTLLGVCDHCVSSNSVGTVFGQGLQLCWEFVTTACPQTPWALFLVRHTQCRLPPTVHPYEDWVSGRAAQL